MTDIDDDRRQVVQEIITKHGREQQAKDAHDYQRTSVDGVETTEKFRELLRQALAGQLPDLGEIPEADPEVAKLAAELVTLHLPEWRNLAGRSLAKPTVVTMPLAPRVADYLVARGWVHDPSRERVRWIPTPGTSGGPHDPGMHIEPDEYGQWPAPDPEAFYDIDDIKVVEIDGGRWCAQHPRGIAFEADTKSEAYEGIVGRLRAKIKEAKAAAEEAEHA